ncbi:hypothetical protein BCCGELA001_29370 [Bradyrhizobium sp. CCGE-LA001]|nr:hypothetical protein BCCGELA001_29370 [Bradyrhizobium sp. CCGE-LA001]
MPSPELRTRRRHFGDYSDGRTRRGRHLVAAGLLVRSSLREKKLTHVLPGWTGKGDGGVYAILPPGRLVPAKTRVFVEAIAEAIKAGWFRD